MVAVFVHIHFVHVEWFAVGFHVGAEGAVAEIQSYIKKVDSFLVSLDSNAEVVTE